MNPMWILMFYSLPTKPERNRLRIYRRLQKEGTLLLNGAHLLPYSDDQYEFFQWLHQEIITLGGDMNFVTIEKIEMMDNAKVIELFQVQAEASYSEIEERIDTITSDLSKVKDAMSVEQEHGYRQTLKKLAREFDALYTIDFFNSNKGQKFQKAIQNLQTKLDSVISPIPTVPLCKISDYQNKQWQTRPRPFVDRMASAWLIQKFIDLHAELIFSNTIDEVDPTIITYDMNNATFTHIGDLCTFEVLLQSFSIQDSALASIAKIIHNLDVNDDKYVIPEAEGIKMILTAIRNNSSDDHEIIANSNKIFDYLYHMHEVTLIK